MRKAGVGRRIAAALANPRLKGAVRKTTDSFLQSRERAVTEIKQWEEWREQARALRSHTVANLAAYLEEFAANVRANGGHVHFAVSAEDAVRIVLTIARRYKVKTVAKSKSMISEEIQLNPALEAEGIEVIETDLGEYILQLAGETPSHLVGPALHKTRDDVAELFGTLKGERMSSDTPTLTAFARERLRSIFLKADMGITGCNFAVAETGSVTLVTNEGNGRMVTSLPRVHVTLMGMERIVPRLEDLDLLLTMLTRSATGQRSTSYVTVTSGPAQVGEKDGPEAFHVVIVDNGRSQLLGTEFQEALHCIRCAACLNVCPVYRQVGGHAYGWVYSGPIGAVLTPLYRGIDEWGDVAQASSLCAACYEICPVKIPLHDMLIAIRARQAQTRKARRMEKLVFRAFGAVTSRPGLYRTLLRAGRVLQRPFDRKGRFTKVPPPLKGWLQGRTLPTLPRRTFRELWADELASAAEGSQPVKSGVRTDQKEVEGGRDARVRRRV